MDEEDGYLEIGDRSAPRKRRNTKNWKRNKNSEEKRFAYVNKTCSTPQCKHKRGSYKCNLITENDITSIRKIYANHITTVDKNRYILTQVNVDVVNRHRPRNSSRKPKLVSASYSLRLLSKKRILVCKNTFMHVLGVGSGRLNRLTKFYLEHGEANAEKRGGDHKKKKFGAKRLSVLNFISKLKARESHYGRQKSCRLYLPHELKSIRNICDLYNSGVQNNLKVEYGFFRGIFRSKFNLAIGTPRTDVCASCLRFKNLLLIEKDPVKKEIIRGEARTHKLRAKGFYQLLKRRFPGVKDFSFDYEQNQALPKLPVQEAFFSRQLNFYNCTIVESDYQPESIVKESGSQQKPMIKQSAVRSKTLIKRPGAQPKKLSKRSGIQQKPKTKDEYFSYIWTEDAGRKDSNEIASIVCHRLMSSNYKGIKKVRLFADGCGGQNKNVQLLCMVSW